MHVWKHHHRPTAATPSLHCAYPWHRLLLLQVMAYMFELGCIFHSFIIGLTVGVNKNNFSEVCVAAGILYVFAVDACTYVCMHACMNE